MAVQVGPAAQGETLARRVLPRQLQVEPRVVLHPDVLGGRGERIDRIADGAGGLAVAPLAVAQCEAKGQVGGRGEADGAEDVAPFPVAVVAVAGVLVRGPVESAGKGEAVHPGRAAAKEIAEAVGGGGEGPLGEVWGVVAELAGDCPPHTGVPPAGDDVDHPAQPPLAVEHRARPGGELYLGDVLGGDRGRVELHVDGGVHGHAVQKQEHVARPEAADVDARHTLGAGPHVDAGQELQRLVERSRPARPDLILAHPVERLARLFSRPAVGAVARHHHLAERVALRSAPARFAPGDGGRRAAES